MDIIQPSELDFPILVVGAGGVGSWATLSLAKMGCENISVVDFDQVEKKNLPSQFYKEGDVGSDKVRALTYNIKEFSGTTIKPISGTFRDNYDENSPYKVVVCGLDSLDGRRGMWNKLAENNNWDALIDIRMAADVIRVFVVSAAFPPSVDKYIKSLDQKTPPHQEECTGRSVVYNTFVCGGLVANIVKKYARKQDVKNSFLFDLTNVEVF